MTWITNLNSINIKNLFDQYDSDKNGYFDKKEHEKIVQFVKKSMEKDHNLYQGIIYKII
jgi:hypothetical protein